MTASVNSQYMELKTKVEDLRLRCEQKSAKLLERQVELDAAKNEAAELRCFLQGSGARNTSVVPSEIRAGPGRVSNPETELQRVIMWLAEHAILEEPVAFNAACDIIVGDEHIQMREIIQWRLTDDLRLSVPIELASEISNLLSVVKGNTSATVSAKAMAIADSWTLTQVEDGTSIMTLLMHKESKKACTVADFPVPPPPSPGHLQRWAGVSVGDHVEVNFQGQWFTGTVCCIKDGGLTYVHCDVDPPDVLTTAPYTC